MENSKEIKDASREDLVAFINDLRCVQCEHYVNGEWSSYDGNVYCQKCWDINRAYEEISREEEITALKKRLTDLGETV